jgi:hypothetical protein
MSGGVLWGAAAGIAPLAAERVSFGIFCNLRKTVLDALSCDQSTIPHAHDADRRTVKRRPSNAELERP